MKVKRKELLCIGGKITVEEFHDGYRMHVAVIAERLPDPIADEYGCAYRELGIPVKAERREIRFSVSDMVVMQLVQKGELGAETDIITALKVLARAAWSHQHDRDPVWGHQYVWAPQANTTSGCYGYGFDFQSPFPSEGLDH